MPVIKICQTFPCQNFALNGKTAYLNASFIENKCPGIYADKYSKCIYLDLVNCSKIVVDSTFFWQAVVADGKYNSDRILDGIIQTQWAYENFPNHMHMV